MRPRGPRRCPPSTPGVPGNLVRAVTLPAHIRVERIPVVAAEPFECADGTFYTGYTPKLRRRVRLHNAGRGARYTRTRRPVKLVWSKKYRHFKRAFKREIAIKKLSRPAKEALVESGR